MWGQPPLHLSTGRQKQTEKQIILVCWESAGPGAGRAPGKAGTLGIQGVLSREGRMTCSSGKLGVGGD